MRVLASAAIVVLAGLFSIGGGNYAAAQQINAADTIFYNGKVLTVDDAFSIVQAIAVKDGRVLSVGANDVVRKLAGPRTESIDLNGQTMVPGLMDTHSHLDGAGEGALVVQLRDVKSVAEAQARIKAFVADKPTGTWVRSSGWHPPSQLAEHRYLTRQEIDAVAPNNPVYLQTVGHFAMANTKALQAGGVTKDTKDPTGGKIFRDDSGEATGVLEESGMDFVEKKVPSLTHAELIARNIAAQHVYSSYGITSLVVTGVSEEMIDIYREVAKSGQAVLRLAPLWRPEIRGDSNVDKFKRAVEATKLHQNDGDEWVKISGIKISIDGGMTLKTAYLRNHYPNEPNNFGTNSVVPEVYKAAVLIAYQHGWRVMTHAVGDRAVDLALDGYDGIKRDGPVVPLRYTVTHGSLIQPDQIERAKRMGVRVDGQNVFMWDKAVTVVQNIGSEMAQHAVPTRSLIERLGFSMTAAGTDSPSTNIINPYINLYIMVTRKDPNGVTYGADQAITREQALRLYTMAGPYFSFEEKAKGTLEPGKFADMTVLSADYMTIPAEEIKNLQAVQTIVNGKVVYKR